MHVKQESIEAIILTDSIKVTFAVDFLRFLAIIKASHALVEHGLRIGQPFRLVHVIVSVNYK
jgi:hypothetical protein